MLDRICPQKFYFELRFEDIPPQWILGAACLACGRKAPVDRDALEEAYGRKAMLRHIDDYLWCHKCKCRGQCRFVVYGSRVPFK